MRSPRPSRLVALAVTLGGLLACTLAAQDKVPVRDKKKTVDHTIKIDRDVLNDYESVTAPYLLEGEYSTNAMGMEIDVAHNGTNNGPKDAPMTSTSWGITLDYTKDTTNEDVTANLRPKHTTDNKAFDIVYGVTFIKDGMGPPFADKLPPGKKLAKKAEKPGDPVPADFHRGNFPVSKFRSPPSGYQARVWIQGRYSAGSLKPEYDLPAVLSWAEWNGKWYPRWEVDFKTPMQAETPKHDPHNNGEKPLTVMRAVLLDDKGKVLHIVTYKYW